MIKKKYHKGFTLVELILYIGVVSIFLTGAILFTWDIVYGSIKAKVQREVNYTIRYASERIGYELRNAQGTNSITNSSIELANADPERNPTTITLVNDQIMIGWGTSGACPAASPCPMTSPDVSVAELVFSDLSDGNQTQILFNITVESVADRSEFQYSQSYESAITMRR